MIWVSILGALPFTLLLPYLELWGTAVMSIMTGLILSSAFSAMVVYAQELVPGKVGMIAGFVFGFALTMTPVAGPFSRLSRSLMTVASSIMI